MIKAHVNTLKHNQEFEVFKHLASITAEHSGRLHVRQLEDSFKMKSCNGEHDFFVLAPLGMSMRTLQELHEDGIFAQSVVEGALDQVLFGLNFLHEADVIHTGNPHLALAARMYCGFRLMNNKTSTRTTYSLQLRTIRFFLR